MTIVVPIGNITIQLGPPDPDSPGRFLGGSLTHGAVKRSYSVNDQCIKGDRTFESMMDAVESILLAHACAGIDVINPAYLEGLQTAINACTNALI